MKATLEFNLPEDKMEFNRVNQSLDMACALFDILQLRKITERRFESIDNINNDVFDGIDCMAKGISDILDKYNINIDKLIE
jgi:hypothetical protein